MSNRLSVGLTGGIGSGKSFALTAFKRLGARTISLDEISHEQARPGGVAYRAIVAAFGKGVLDVRRSIDRAKLGRLVFARPALLQRLEALTHTLVLREMHRRLKALRGIVVIDVPLLFEGGYEALFDLTMLICAPRALRLKRLNLRGLTRAEGNCRMKAQLSDAVKARRADVIVSNAGGRQDFLRRIKSYQQAFVLMRQPQ